MAKHNRQTKGLTHPNRGSAYVQQETYDDSLLPEAIELQKLKDLDPTIIEWIKERTAKEQDARIDFNDRKMGLIEKSSSRGFFIDFYAITCAFIIIMAGMALSYFLIKNNLTVIGTIFAGGTLVLAANAFLNFRKKLVEIDNKK